MAIGARVTVWKPITDAGSGYLFSLSDSIRIVEEKHPGLLVPLADGTVVIASDYSGQHKGATHEAYAFLITNDVSLRRWLPLVAAVRQRWLPDNRRISFKRVREPVRWRALPAFLDAASYLHGNLVTILVDRRIGSFFPGGAAAVVEVFPDCFDSNANFGTVEKMLRIASFLALVISGLRREDQPSQWISDHDEALDSCEKREQLGRLAAYLTFGVTKWRAPADNYFGTTELPTAPTWAEDLATVPDLVAGAYCQMSDHLPSFFGKTSWVARMNSESVGDDRARLVGNWLSSHRRGLLRHVLLRMELDIDGEVRTSAQGFLR